MQAQLENIQINWCRGSSCAEFVFKTHQQASDFAE